MSRHAAIGRVLAAAAIITALLLTRNARAQVIHWRRAAILPDAAGVPKGLGLAGAACGISNGCLLVAGGNNFPAGMPWAGGMKKYYSAVYIYKINKHTGGLTLAAVRQLPYNIAYAAVCTTPQGLVMAGGENENGIRQSCIMLSYDTKTGQLHEDVLPDLPKPITNAALAYSGETLYLAGGENMQETYKELYSLPININSGSTWQKQEDMPQPASHMVLTANSGVLYAAGGRSKDKGRTSSFYNTTYTYVKERGWQQVKNMPVALSAACGVNVGGGMLVVSGDDGSTYNKVETEILAAAETTRQDREKHLRQRVQLQQQHPGFRKESLFYSYNKGSWAKMKGLLQQPPVTAGACVYMNKYVYVAGGEVRAGVRTANILMATIN